MLDREIEIPLERLEDDLAESLRCVDEGDVVLVTREGAVVAEIRQPGGDTSRHELAPPLRRWTWKPRRCERS